MSNKEYLKKNLIKYLINLIKVIRKKIQFSKKFNQSTTFWAAFYILGISVRACDVILVVVLFLEVRALVVVVGFRVTLSLLECYLLLVFLESSLGAFVAGANLLHLAVWAGGGLPILRAFCANASGAFLTNH